MVGGDDLWHHYLDVLLLEVFEGVTVQVLYVTIAKDYTAKIYINVTTQHHDSLLRHQLVFEVFAKIVFEESCWGVLVYVLFELLEGIVSDDKHHINNIDLELFF